jgi:hypothetical protein
VLTELSLLPRVLSPLYRCAHGFPADTVAPNLLAARDATTVFYSGNSDGSHVANVYAVTTGRLQAKTSIAAAISG